MSGVVNVPGALEQALANGVPPQADKAMQLAATHVAWIRRVASDRDRTAFSHLFAFFAPRLKAFLIRGGVAPDLADELSQEAMLLVWRKAEQFDPDRASASTWIYTIARNLRIDAARRRVLIEVSEEELGFDEGSADDLQKANGDIEDVTAAAASALQREARVREAIGCLPEEQAQVVTLAFFYGRVHAELAQELNLPLGTVKSRLRLATQKLRTLLGELST